MDQFRKIRASDFWPFLLFTFAIEFVFGMVKAMLASLENLKTTYENTTTQIDTTFQSLN